MVTPTEQEKGYGAIVWLGNSQGKSKKEKGDHQTDFLNKDLFFLDGRGKQRIYIVPSRDLIILRVGLNPKKWDDAFLPNLIEQTQRWN